MKNTPYSDRINETTNGRMMNDAVANWQNRPLNQDLFAKIHYQAVHQTAYGRTNEYPPETITKILSQTNKFGYRGHLFPSEHVHSIGKDLTTFWYQQIEACFCQSARPSVPNIWQIINRRRHQNRCSFSA